MSGCVLLSSLKEIPFTSSSSTTTGTTGISVTTQEVYPTKAGIIIPRDSMSSVLSSLISTNNNTSHFIGDEETYAALPMGRGKNPSLIYC